MVEANFSQSGRAVASVKVATLLTMVLLVTHIAVRQALPAGHAGRLLLTAATVGGFAFFVWSYARMTRALDEFERHVQFIALSIAFPTALVLIFAVGFLRAEGLLSGADPRDLMLLLLVPYLVAHVVAGRRYR